MDNAPPELREGMVVFVSPEGMDWSGHARIVGFEDNQVKLKIRNGLMTISVDPSSLYLQE